MAKKAIKPGKKAAKKAAPKRGGAKKAVKGGAKKSAAPAKKNAPSKAKKAIIKKSPVKKAPAKGAPARKATPAKPTAKKSVPVKKSAIKAPSKKAAAPATKASAKKSVKTSAGSVPAGPKQKGSIPGKGVARPAGGNPVAAPDKLTPKAAAAKAAARAAAAKAEAQAATPIGPTMRFPDVAQPTGSYNGIILTDQIKPFPKKSPYSTKELEMLRETLSNERNQLIRELNSLNSTSREVMDLSKEHPGYSMHLAEHATDLQTAEASLGVRSIVQERLMQVDTALKRLEENPNHFGLCLACGNKIGLERLRSRPHAHLCMDCRTRYERVRARRGM